MIPSAKAQDIGYWATATENYVITLKDDIPIRYLKNDILEKAALIYQGTVIEFPKGQTPVQYLYRDSSGGLSRSSNGFMGQVTILSVPANHASQFPQSKIDELNQTEGGLYISASVVNGIDQNPIIPALTPAEPGADYLLNYYENGKPKVNFTSSFKKRFGDRLNLNIPMESLSPRDQQKWQSIYNELKRVGDRTVSTERIYLFLEDESQAGPLSLRFEQTGEISPIGAWSIAVRGTAERHGFANVPCAEFMSEMVREAYQRAGYSIKEDFNDETGNYLIYSNTAAVVNLATALFKGGWIPWDSKYYIPPTGAPIMNATANTPGHTYMSGGDNGRFIVDNGSPRGRDLRTTSDKIIKMMFQTGVFFLPPGIIPEQWENK